MTLKPNNKLIPNFAVLLILSLTLLFGGCGGGNGTITLARHFDTVDRRTNAPANGYFHYIEAQRQRNSGNNPLAMAALKAAVKADPGSIFLQRELALWLWQGGEPGQALEILNSIVAKHGDDLESMVLLGQLQQRMKLPEAAKATLERAWQLRPENEAFYLLLGEIYLEEDQLAAAKEVYEALVAKFPRSYVGYYYLGRIHRTQNDPGAALTALERTVQLAPELEEPRFELAELYTQLKRWEDARKAYQGILDENPNHLRTQIALGRLLVKMDDTQPAAIMFERAARRCNDDPNLLQTIFHQFWDQEAYAAGLQVFKSLAPHIRTTTDHYYWQGLFHEALEEWEAAVGLFQSVADESPYHPKAVVHATYLVQDLGRIDEAIAYLEQIVKRITDNPEFYLYLAGLYEEIKSYDRALKVVAQGLSLDENSTGIKARLHFRRGVVMDKLGRKAETIDAMRLVIDLEPQNATALNYLGYTYADLGENLDQAEVYIREALKYKPDDGYITDSLGWVYYQRGEYAQALEILLRASELAPDDPIILEHVGDAYLKISDRENALIFYRRSLDKEPEERDDLKRKIEQILEHNG